ncbi:MAG: glycosyltransferase family 2 protein [Lysobacterales bacterium]
MKFSIVTISFNQAQFLEQAIRSVIEQDYPDVEYIVVDPGSTDGSREIIERYRDRIDRIIFEPDNGPADGLNKGFAQATGDIFGFINSDDYLLPGALSTVSKAFSSRLKIDVLSGHALIVDANGIQKNRFYSRRFSLDRFIYGAATLAQQSTFFRSGAFINAGGFNVDNRIAWDGELWVDMALTGAMFGRIPAFLSAFRIHADAITGGGGHTTDAYFKAIERVFYKVKNRPKNRVDPVVRIMYKILEYALDPRIAMERLLQGPVIPRR